MAGLNVLYRYFSQPLKVNIMFYLLPVAMPQFIHLLWTRAIGVIEGMWHNDTLPLSVNFCLVTKHLPVSRVLNPRCLDNNSQKVECHLWRESCIHLLYTQYWNLKTKIYSSCLMNLYYLPALGKILQPKIILKSYNEVLLRRLKF